MRSPVLEVRPLGLEGVLEIQPKRIGDDRGFFSEVWNRARWRTAGIDSDFVQDNHSLSTERGVLRGMHYQAPPMAQAKLVRVTRGAVFDVAVDVRLQQLGMSGIVQIVSHPQRQCSFNLLTVHRWPLALQTHFPRAFAVEGLTQLKCLNRRPRSPRLRTRGGAAHRRAAGC